MAVRRRIGPSQSPVVPAAVTRLRQYSRANAAIKWGVVSSVAMILILIDMYIGTIAYVTKLNSQMVWIVESVILLILFLCVLYDITLYMSLVLRNPAVKVTSSQKTMLGIPAGVTGFQTVPTPVQFGPSITSTPNRNQNRHTPPVATPFSGAVTPSYYYRTCSPGSNYSTPSRTPSFSSSYGHTPNRSSPGHSTSPFSSDCINSMSSLEQYLKTEEEKYIQDVASSQGCWYSSPSSDTPSLRKYHVATRTLSPKEDEEGIETDSIWSKLNIKREELSQWTGRCRKWLAQTVIIPVAMEIKSVNKKLQEMGSTEVTVGTATLAQLKDIARIRTHLLPSLSMLIRYLELSSKQDYLVKRIQELADGSSIGAYKWNAGSSWKGRKWDQDLPSDPQIILHFLCTYLDSQIPPSPQFPDGKTFTNQYFLKTPDKPENKKADVSIYQSSINPPHYKVLWKDSCVEIPKGRHNLFYAIIVFLHYIKHEEKGLLGYLDLELSGLNLLWIIDIK